MESGQSDSLLKGGETGMEYVLGGMFAGIIVIVAAESFLYA